MPGVPLLCARPVGSRFRFSLAVCPWLGVFEVPLFWRRAQWAPGGWLCGERGLGGAFCRRLGLRWVVAVRCWPGPGAGCWQLGVRRCGVSGLALGWFPVVGWGVAPCAVAVSGLCRGCAWGVNRWCGAVCVGGCACSRACFCACPCASWPWAVGCCLLRLSRGGALVWGCFPRCPRLLSGFRRA